MERQWSEKVGRKSSSDRVGSVVEYQVLTFSSAKELLHACDAALGFLRGYGFSNPMFSGEAAARNCTTRFYGKYLAVECIWDSVEQAVEVKVARLRDGKPPGEFAMDANGRRVREHLTTLLVRRGVRDFQFPRMSARTPLPERSEAQLREYARLLQKYGQAILNDEPGVLERLDRGNGRSGAGHRRARVGLAIRACGGRGVHEGQDCRRGSSGVRCLATEGDTQFRTAADALAEAIERHGIDPSTVETELKYGKKPNLLGPDGKPWEVVRGLNEDGDIVEFQHHSNGHNFDDGTFELPHYHGPDGEHLTYGQ
jgi:hypothetical protein